LLISDSAHMLRTLIGDDIHLTTVLDPSAGLVRIDAGSFHQVLMNLAVNARDAMPHGGTLTITTTSSTISGSTEHLAAPGEYVEVAVSDSGTGMTEEVREHLFEPFFTTKDQGKGTGLGLSMVYGIVQQSGGHILVETAPENGTTFRLYFPTVTVGGEPSPEDDPPVVPLRGSETILLVEDHDDVRQLTARTLRDLGYNVLEADSPSHALELGLDRSRTIHLLLTDIVMPRVNGFDLASRIRTYHSRIKVLYMSGNAGSVDVSEKVTQDGSAFLQKPFSPHALATTIRDLLDR
jgi:two-component system, cell cycle sensor histidine kinase and response regulator CckA